MLDTILSYEDDIENDEEIIKTLCRRPRRRCAAEGTGLDPIDRYIYMSVSMSVSVSMSASMSIGMSMGMSMSMSCLLYTSPSPRD